MLFNKKMWCYFLWRRRTKKMFRKKKEEESFFSIIIFNYHFLWEKNKKIVMNCQEYINLHRVKEKHHFHYHELIRLQVFLQ